jgi:hypothetical protein
MLPACHDRYAFSILRSPCIRQNYRIIPQIFFPHMEAAWEDPAPKEEKLPCLQDCKREGDQEFTITVPFITALSAQ